jgi:S-formylglutathione hydrolase FrmB
VPQRPISQAESKPHPVLYLLHGGSDNQTGWQRNTSIERYVWGLDVIVVMPSAHYSFYADQKHGLRYFTFLSEELPHIVGDLFHASNRREDTYAAGLSMGGYGAFKLGIAKPDCFAAVASLSGSLDQRSRLGEKPALSNQVMLDMARHTFGTVEDYDHSDNDLAWLLERHLENGTRVPRLYQACGTKDHNYEINADFHRRFAGRLDLTYVEVPGRGHEWAFWDEYIRNVLAWLNLKRL